LAPYDFPAHAFDEAFSAPHEVRAQYRDVVAALYGCDLRELSRVLADDVAAAGMEFRTGGEGKPFPIDPVPRIVEGDEWHALERGLAQRAEALNTFMADICRERRIVAAGVMPARVLDSAEMAEPDMAAVAPASGVHAAVCGFDVVRGAGGELRVLEDNLRTPSGLAYVEAARTILDERLPFAAPGERAPLRIAELLGEALRGAAPPGAGGDPSLVLLSDGPANSAWWEHRRLARALDIPLVAPRDIELRRGRICAWDGRRSLEVDVIYRRTDEDRLRDRALRPTWLGALLLEPLRHGRIACVNAFGNGVADDKLVHAYVEDMVRFYLGEEPAIRSVATFDPGEPAARAEVLERIDDLVVKPRNGSGGTGVIVCPHATPEDRALAARLIATRPESFVAQETISISTHPTAVGATLEPRHVDLRPFAFCTPSGGRVMCGGLTRVALDRGALVVNSSMNGGGKDTWMLG
jgi:uncharacterized circularly permuted ATP-grasp superfamily protein